MSPRGGSRAGHPGVGGERKGAGRKPAPRDVNATRALLLSWAPPEDRNGSELAPRAADRLAARIGVTRQAVSEAWRKGLTAAQVDVWTAKITG